MSGKDDPTPDACSDASGRSQPNIEKDHTLKDISNRVLAISLLAALAGISAQPAASAPRETALVLHCTYRASDPGSVTSEETHLTVDLQRSMVTMNGKSFLTGQLDPEQHGFIERVIITPADIDFGSARPNTALAAGPNYLTIDRMTGKFAWQTHGKLAFAVACERVTSQPVF